MKNTNRYEERVHHADRSKIDYVYEDISDTKSIPKPMWEPPTKYCWNEEVMTKTIYHFHNSYERSSGTAPKSPVSAVCVRVCVVVVSGGVGLC